MSGAKSQWPNPSDALDDGANGLSSWIEKARLLDSEQGATLAVNLGTFLMRAAEVGGALSRLLDLDPTAREADEQALNAASTIVNQLPELKSELATLEPPLKALVKALQDRP